MAYPTGIKIFIDDKDATYYLFGAPTIDPTAEKHVWRDVDITTYLRKGTGIHTIVLTATDGTGRVDARIEVR